jgi:hypothetical protein
VKRLNKVLGLAILIATLILTPLYTTTRGELKTLQIGTQSLSITIDGNPVSGEHTTALVKHHDYT